MRKLFIALALARRFARTTVRATLMGVRIDTLAIAGASVHESALAAIVFTAQPTVELSIIDGDCVVIEAGVLAGVDLPALVTEHNRCARSLMGG